LGLRDSGGGCSFGAVCSDGLSRAAYPANEPPATGAALAAPRA